MMESTVRGLVFVFDRTVNVRLWKMELNVSRCLILNEQENDLQVVGEKELQSLRETAHGDRCL